MRYGEKNTPANLLINFYSLNAIFPFYSQLKFRVNSLFNKGKKGKKTVSKENSNFLANEFWADNLSEVTVNDQKSG